MSNKAPDKSGYYWVRCVMDNFYGEWQIIFYDGAEIETCGFKRKLQLKDIGEWGEEVTHQSLSVETPEELKEEISEIIFKNKWFFSNNKEHADMLVEKLSPSITRYASAIKEKAVKEAVGKKDKEIAELKFELNEADKHITKLLQKQRSIDEVVANRMKEIEDLLDIHAQDPNNINKTYVRISNHVSYSDWQALKGKEQ